MPPHPIPPELRAAAPALAQGVAAVLAALAALIARAFLHNPRRVALIRPLWSRLTRAGRRFARAMDRLAAGTPTRPRHPRAHSGAPSTHLPANHGWLVAELRHEAVAFALRLEHALSTPEAAALLAASPQAARILRPICRMLGIRPAALPPPPRRPRATAPAESPPAATPPAATPPAAIPPPATSLGATSLAATPDSPPTRWRLSPPPCPRVRWPWFPHPAARGA